MLSRLFLLVRDYEIFNIPHIIQCVKWFSFTV